MEADAQAEPKQISEPPNAAEPNATIPVKARVSTSFGGSPAQVMEANEAQESAIQVDLKNDQSKHFRTGSDEVSQAKKNKPLGETFLTSSSPLVQSNQEMRKATTFKEAKNQETENFDRASYPESQREIEQVTPLLPNGLDTINDRVSEFTEIKIMKSSNSKKTVTLASVSGSDETGGFGKVANSSPHADSSAPKTLGSS